MPVTLTSRLSFSQDISRDDNMGATSTIEKVDTDLVKPGLTDHVEYGVDVEERTATPYDHIETSKVLHKVDRRLLPMLALLYLIAFLDRGNLGNAKVSPYEHYYPNQRMLISLTRWLEWPRTSNSPAPSTIWPQQYEPCGTTAKRCMLTLLQLFFIPYALLEVPSNVVLKMLRPSRWLAALVVAWGTVC